ncbi:MAG TPA: hypothetical protein VNZ67_10185, partial [bacterium]|nr:hypothetical protein [bacterium]
MENKHPSLSERLHFLALWPGDLLLGLVSLRFESFRRAFSLVPPRYLAWAGRWRARRAHYRALRRVPAYRALAAAKGGAPITDKAAYIDAFPMAERCLDGRLPFGHAAIDESSGSTGRPYNWVRGIKERQQSHLSIAYFVAYCFGRGRFITLNAFSMGAWATGVNMGLALQKNSLVKNTGPDVEKLLATLKAFGPGQPYLITGYPPFLKLLIDSAAQQGFDLEPYTLWALVGG